MISARVRISHMGGVAGRDRPVDERRQQVGESVVEGGDRACASLPAAGQSQRKHA